MTKDRGPGCMALRTLQPSSFVLCLLLRKFGTNETEVMRVLTNRARKIVSERIHALGLNSQSDLDIRPDAGKMRDYFIHNFGNLGRTT